MTEQSLDNWIINYEGGQKQSHANLLRQIKNEFYRLRDEQRRSRRAAFDNLNCEPPPPKMGTKPAALDTSTLDEWDRRR